jgi:hypothetical protein
MYEAVFIREYGRHTTHQRGEYRTEVPRHNEIESFENLPLSFIPAKAVVQKILKRQDTVFQWYGDLLSFT